jgi:adenosine deaminase/adenosine deaminase CECR1
MIEQYVLLASRYKDVSYADIKQYVYNSINYSFIQNENIKKQLLKDLDSFTTLRPISFKIDQNEYQTDRHWQNG